MLAWIGVKLSSGLQSIVCNILKGKKLVIIESNGYSQASWDIEETGLLLELRIVFSIHPCSLHLICSQLCLFWEDLIRHTE